MSKQMVTENRQNVKRLVCTECGNERPHVYLRDRDPQGMQLYASCFACGSRNWVGDQHLPYARIRYTEQAQAVEPTLERVAA